MIGFLNIKKTCPHYVTINSTMFYNIKNLRLKANSAHPASVIFNESNLYNHPCWCKCPCSGMILGKLGSVCCPLISNFMLLAMLRFPRAKFKSGSVLVGATLSSVVEALNGGGSGWSGDSSVRSWLCVCSCLGGIGSRFSGTVGRVGTLDALCNVFEWA